MSLAATVVVVTALTSGACSESTDTTTRILEAPAASRPITESEAATLADVLVANHDLGGADVRAIVPFGSSEFVLVGEIDWRNHVGRLTVSPTVEESPGEPFDVVFNQQTVFEQVPGLADRLAAQARGRANWVARPLDASRSPLDIVLRLIDTAASTTRDNPVLLQSRGITWMRRENLNDRPADVFDSGRTTYWVEVASKRLVRIEAELEATSSIATVDLTNPAPRTVDTPVETDIIALESVQDLYNELRGAR